jgi:hypothetical protein
MRTHCDRGLRTLLVFAALVAMTSAVGAARAQSWGQLAELSQSVGLVSGFGTSVAISGSTAVVGEPSADGGQGAVYVFVESAGGWGNMTQTAKLTASDGSSTAALGTSVAISGSTIVAGAPGGNATSNYGNAYVFEEPAGGWTDMTQTAELKTIIGVVDTKFGASVAISADGNYIVAGQPGKGSRVPGAAYLFVKGSSASTWHQKAELTASDGGGNLGNSVSISGNVVVAGAPTSNPTGVSAYGAVYLFQKPSGGWTNMTQTAKLTSSGLNLGASVDIDGGVVVAGAPQTSISYTDQGAAYVFVKPSAGWANMNPTAQLTASDAFGYDDRGEAISISNNTVVVGAPRHSFDYHQNAGEAYVYVEPAGGWVNTTETAKLNASDAQHGQNLGSSVSISGSTAIAGAPSLPSPAYIFGM